MADWFKFYNDGLDSKGMQFAMSEQPLVTSVWLVILSEASKNRSRRIKWNDEDFELIGYARKINVSLPIFNQSIGLLERAGYIRRHNGNIEIEGWDKMQSDYARGLDKGYYKKTSKKLASHSKVSTARREEKRVEENKDFSEVETAIMKSGASILPRPVPANAGEHKAFIDGWHSNFKENFKFDYAFVGGRDGKAVKEILSIGILRIDLLEIAKKAWKQPKLFACRQASTIHGFYHNLNQIRTELNGALIPNNSTISGNLKTHDSKNF